MTTESQPPSRILHLMTQDNQPYGSERRCCELCGIMLIGADAPRWTDDRRMFERGSLPDVTGYIRCNGKLPSERNLREEFKTNPHQALAPEPNTSIREKLSAAEQPTNAGVKGAQQAKLPFPPEGRASTVAKKKAFLSRVLAAWEKKPDQRLGQLMVNLAPGCHPNPDLFYVEDEDLLGYLEGTQKATPDQKERMYTEADMKEAAYLIAAAHVMELAKKETDKVGAALEKLSESLKAEVDDPRG